MRQKLSNSRWMEPEDRNVKRMAMVGMKSLLTERDRETLKIYGHLILMQMGAISTRGHS